MKTTHTLIASLALAALLISTGCNNAASDKTNKPDAGKTAAKTEEGHGAAPHGGVLVEWGAEEFHVEFIVDKAKGEAVGYVLGPDAKTATPIKADKLTLTINEPKLTLDMLPEPQTGETGGKASKFVAKNDAFAKDAKFGGGISGAVDGKPYDGDFKQ